MKQFICLKVIVDVFNSTYL